MGRSVKNHNVFILKIKRYWDNWYSCRANPSRVNRYERNTCIYPTKRNVTNYVSLLGLCANYSKTCLGSEMLTHPSNDAEGNSVNLDEIPQNAASHECRHC